MSLPLLLTAVLAAAAPSRPLTFDDVYHPGKKLALESPPSAQWVSDTHYLWPRREGEDVYTVLRVEALSGKAEPLFDARLEPALAAEGVPPEQAKPALRRRAYAMDRAATGLVLEAAGDLFHYRLADRRLRRLTRSPAKEEQAMPSPDGARVAFVREHDLYVVDVETGRERRLTRDGSEDVLNGKLDWVYQEEIYGRGRFRAFWWSPDGRRLAFLRLDEKGVPRYTLVDEIPYRGAVTTYPYPKAGDPNPAVQLGVAAADEERPVMWIDLGVDAEAEPLVVDVSWTPDGGSVAFQVQDREQRWLELKRADPQTGRARLVLRETTPAWVEVQGSPQWLRDGSFLWLSERSGWKHLYRHGADGASAKPLTSGEWEVRELHGVDEAAGWVYFSGTERSLRGLDVYRVRLDGGGLERLSQQPGTHEARFSPSLRLWTDSWSRLWSPPQVRLHRADGSEVRLADAGPAEKLAGYGLAEPEFLEVPARDGFVLPAMLFKPVGFDASRRYPVYQFTYGGPAAPQVRDRWNPEHLFHQLLLQRGVAVWVCDNRSASGKGAASVWPIYQRLGERELADVEDCLAWLKRQPWVDGARVGLHGRSYGGFMTTYALTHSGSFRMGIAGSAVTDWRDYDSVYTERYMRTPANNPDGYRRTAPRHAAGDLRGSLLLFHGLMDDNVHPQNATHLAYELQKAGKPFRLMTYAKSEHRIGEPELVRHFRAMMLEFIEETLGPLESQP